MTGRWRVAMALVAVTGTRAAATSGPALDYALNCQGCHRADGTGTPGSVPVLAGSVAKFLKVPGGREYLSQVPGAAQAPIDDAALAAVLNWMVDRFDHADVPADFRPYTPEEVGRLRGAPIIDVTTRRALIEKIERLQ